MNLYYLQDQPTQQKLNQRVAKILEQSPLKENMPKTCNTPPLVCITTRQLCRNRFSKNIKGLMKKINAADNTTLHELLKQRYQDSQLAKHTTLPLAIMRELLKTRTEPVTEQHDRPKRKPSRENTHTKRARYTN